MSFDDRFQASSSVFSSSFHVDVDEWNTRPSTSNYRDPVFKQKFALTLVDGHQEIGVLVWNKNTVIEDYLIGTARVPLETVLLCGSDDNLWALQFAGRFAGNIRLVMNCLRVQDILDYTMALRAVNLATCSQPDHFFMASTPSTPAHPSAPPPQFAVFTPAAPTIGPFTYATPLAAPSDPVRIFSHSPSLVPVAPDGPPLPAHLLCPSSFCNSPSYAAPKYQAYNCDSDSLPSTSESGMASGNVSPLK
ncbi:hypothetical protein EJ110_NYTH21382 [Nymphaea thermarum]|nr:hypothetical protein EJ110_NYTH21382 [Nymphaea thermarum]